MQKYGYNFEIQLKFLIVFVTSSKNNPYISLFVGLNNFSYDLLKQIEKKSIQIRKKLIIQLVKRYRFRFQCRTQREFIIKKTQRLKSLFIAFLLANIRKNEVIDSYSFLGKGDNHFLSYLKQNQRQQFSQKELSFYLTIILQQQYQISKPPHQSPTIAFSTNMKQKYQQRKHDYIVRIVLVGSSAVGKSAILKRFADDDFKEFYISTIGMDFRFKSVMIDNNFVKLQIWDTAGQERFKGVTKTYYSCADAVIIAYDVNQDKTFEEAHQFWLQQAHNNCKEGAKIFVMCNKCDNTDLKIKPEHKKRLQQQNIQYYEVSAKTGKGVSNAIMQIAKKMIKILPKLQDKTFSMELRETHFEGKNMKKQRQGKCCGK